MDVPQSDERHAKCGNNGASILLPELPYWPRYLSREQAAMYVGVSPDTFDMRCRTASGQPLGAGGARAEG